MYYSGTEMFIAWPVVQIGFKNQSVCISWMDTTIILLHTVLTWLLSANQRDAALSSVLGIWSI